MLESTRKVDTVVLDKTGTVTTGKMTLVEVAAADGLQPHRHGRGGHQVPNHYGIADGLDDLPILGRQLRDRHAEVVRKLGGLLISVSLG